MKKKVIGIIGHFGGNCEFLDGQTVKTKTLYNELKKIDRFDFFCVDTYYNKVNKFKLLCDTLKCIIMCDTIIILLSKNGMSIFLPLLYYIKKIFNKKIYHDVIGGNLVRYVEEKPCYIKYLNSFDENWVELNKMKEELEIKGISNCVVVPNFKRLDSTLAKLVLSEEGRNTFCVFSRVMKEKGISEAIYAINNYNKCNESKANLEIWGPIEPSYKEEFENLLKENTKYVKYLGCIDFNKSVEALTDHIALLFPTYWEGEGFPGTIIDAYASGVPVIASDWNANSELIDNFKTGWIYPNHNIKTLDESVAWAIRNKEKMIEMRKNVLNKSKYYYPSKWVAYIISRINS